MLLKLAVRNLVRNLRRTVITLVAIAFGLALMVWAINLNGGTYDEMVEKSVSAMAGHVVVQGLGFQEEREPEITVPDAANVVATLRTTFPDAVVVPRIFGAGLLTSATGSVGVAVNAIEPETEVKVSDWATYVTEGAFLDSADDRGILIGAKMRKTLGVGLGDKVVLMGQGADKEMTSRLFRVRGILRSGSSEIDSFVAVTTVGAMQEFLTQPDRVSQVAVHFDRATRLAERTAQARAAVKAEGVEVLPWQQAIPEVVEMIEKDKQSSNVMMAIIGIIVALGVLNTVLMSVLERMREFGVLLAIGLSPQRLAQLILLEGLVLGFVGVSLGLGLGLLATWPTVVYGLDFSAVMGESLDLAGVALSTKIHAAYDWPRMAQYCAVALVLAVLAALYPAVKAARLRPVQAMQSV